jgi:hypothetical protein
MENDKLFAVVEVATKKLYQEIESQAPPFICDNCGDCCGPVPFNKYEKDQVRKIYGKWKPNKRFVVLLRFQFLAKVPWLGKWLLTCQFRKKGKCSVYNARPFICRLFGLGQDSILQCPHHPPLKGAIWVSTTDNMKSRYRRTMNGEVIL